ncbi:hypothetical protein [Duganella sp. BJB476]|uniref:hypothetical protein n=1 Tax=Duganella sp. BJB476 TaxID=1871176 RepID=UPI000E347392|nr:hypothetical protein [Duganella sp. BJB476]RFP32463.1 hypothetical protein D0T21_09700 [Duganella sp. BJB476]
MSSDNVIHAFKPAELPAQTLTIEKPPAGKKMYCQHGGLRIDPHERSIACAECGQVLDPFDYLLTNAATINRAWQDHGYVKREISDIQDRITELKKEEKRLKAQIKRSADKITVVDVRGKGLL